jgi:hypothetical protein
MKLLRSSVFALMLGAGFPACLIAPADAQVSIDPAQRPPEREEERR